MSSSADSSFRLPIFIDTMTFDDRHEKLFRDFHRQMDTDFSRMRRREFDSDFDRMTRDFYHLRPRSAGSCGGGSSVGGGGSRQRLREDFGSKESLDEDTTSRLIIDNASGGPRKFQISFDVKEYRPDDISVKVDLINMCCRICNTSQFTMIIMHKLVNYAIHHTVYHDNYA